MSNRKRHAKQTLAPPPPREPRSLWPMLAFFSNIGRLLWEIIRRD